MSDSSLSESAPSTAVLEQALRNAVKDVYRSGNLDNLTVKRIRKAVEVDLELGDDFFKNDPAWKEESKTIIQTEVVRAWPVCILRLGTFWLMSTLRIAKQMPGLVSYNRPRNCLQTVLLKAKRPNQSWQSRKNHIKIIGERSALPATRWDLTSVGGRRRLRPKALLLNR